MNPSNIMAMVKTTIKIIFSNNLSFLGLGLDTKGL